MIDISAKDSHISYPIPFGECSFCSHKSTVNGHAVFELKGGIAVIVGLPTSLIGVVGACGDPDLDDDAGASAVEGVLEVGEGIVPGGAVVGAVGNCIYV